MEIKKYEQPELWVIELELHEDILTDSGDKADNVVDVSEQIP